MKRNILPVENHVIMIKKEDTTNINSFLENFPKGFKIKFDPSITTLDLNFQKLGEKEIKIIAKALVDNDTIQEIKLGHCNLGDKEVKILTDALACNASIKNEAYNNSLKTLVLSFNHITSIGAKYLTRVGLETLYLDNNTVGDRGAKALADHPYETLSLKNNKISSVGAEALATRSKIKHLILSHNYDIGAEGAKALAYYNNTIEELDLSFCRTNDIGAKDLATNVNCTKVSLAGNVISQKGAREIARTINNNQNTITLDLTQNPIKNKGITYFRNSRVDNLAVSNLMNEKITTDTFTTLLTRGNINRTIHVGGIKGKEYTRSRVNLKGINGSSTLFFYKNPDALVNALSKQKKENETSDIKSKEFLSLRK